MLRNIVLGNPACRRTLCTAIQVVLWSVLAGEPAGALEPEEILALLRSGSPDGSVLLKHYVRRRGLPEGNFLELRLRDTETIGRPEFDQLVLEPLRKELRRPERAGIRCLLVLRGLPLRVGPGKIEGEEDLAEEERVKRRRATIASFDSELALALRPRKSLEGWAPNPLFRLVPLGVLPRAQLGPNRPLMVSRLDGPSLEIAVRLVDRALVGEDRGLDGFFCFDARGLRGKKNAYAQYDQRIRDAARLARFAKLPVRLNDRPELFGPGECQKTSFYIGWYSLAKYVDAFSFQPGAIALHVASSEAVSLRKGEYWAKRFLEEGVTATMGPTNEPYLQSFPDPVAFLARVIDGRRTLAEIYWESVPQASWRQLLVGDPLYRPHLPRRADSDRRSNRTPQR